MCLRSLSVGACLVLRAWFVFLRLGVVLLTLPLVSKMLRGNASVVLWNMLLGFVSALPKLALLQLSSTSFLIISTGLLFVLQSLWIPRCGMSCSLLVNFMSPFPRLGRSMTISCVFSMSLRRSPTMWCKLRVFPGSVLGDPLVVAAGVILVVAASCMPGFVIHGPRCC